ncbi:MAG: membrane protein insertase YidC [Prevotellamassilia sp.]|nr:membrane protein insertase YidC [Prevotellamassilia sp.]
MDKNTIIGLVLMAAVLIGFSWYNTNQERNLQSNQTEQTTPQKATDNKQPSATTIPVKTTADSTDIFYAATKEQTPKVVELKNQKVSVKINTKGGAISEVRLNEYKSYKDFEAKKENPLLLYSNKDAGLNFKLDTKEGTLDFSNYYFTPINQTDSTVTMRLQASNGASIDVDYKLLADNYLVNFTVKANGMQKYLPSTTQTIQMDWHDRVAQQEKGFYFENMYSTLTYKKHGDDTHKMSENETKEESVTESVDWIAFKNQYFSSVLLAAEPMKNVNVKSEQLEEGSGYLKNYSANMAASFDASGAKPSKFQFYFGPNNYRLLQKMDNYKVSEHDNDLQGLVYLGWPIVKWINRFFTLYVFDFFTRLGLPMGIVLLLITLLLRAIVYVPTRKSYLSSAKMRVLKPKIDEIAAKYPKQEDAMKRQQETMSLYSQYGVSPMGGCLPMLIQMPIWIAMFNFVPNAIELRQQSFLWADDLSTYDSLVSWNTNIWGLGNHLSLFCLLFCATNLLYSFMTMRQQRETMSGEQAQQMKMMQWMMMLMPLFFFFMFNKYSAGLNYYYFISLLFSALTMWYLRKTTDDKKLLAKLEANYQANKNNPNKKPSGLAARLEALQKQQEEMMKRQQEIQQRRQQK